MGARTAAPESSAAAEFQALPEPLDFSAGLQRMRAVQEGRRALSDPEGHFEITSLADGTSFSVIAERPLGGRAKLEGVRTGTEVDLVLQPLGSLAGNAVDDQGMPVRRLTLQVMNPQTEQQRVEVSLDVDGRWSLASITPGRVRLIASDAQRRMSVTEHDLAPGQRLEGVQLQLEAAPR